MMFRKFVVVTMAGIVLALLFSTVSGSNSTARAGGVPINHQVMSTPAVHHDTSPLC